MHRARRTFLAAGAIGGRDGGDAGVRVRGVGADSIQGDVRSPTRSSGWAPSITRGDDWIESTAPDRCGIDIDCVAIPDAAMTLASSRCSRRADDAARHRQLARQGNRPHRGDGDRVAQGRRDG
jgi:5-enolpyruvylshikimate-3-phosphate synthase